MKLLNLISLITLLVNYSSAMRVTKGMIAKPAFSNKQFNSIIFEVTGTIKGKTLKMQAFGSNFYFNELPGTHCLGEGCDLDDSGRTVFKTMKNDYLLLNGQAFEQFLYVDSLGALRFFASKHMDMIQKDSSYVQFTIEDGELHYSLGGETPFYACSLHNRDTLFKAPTGYQIFVGSRKAFPTTNCTKFVPQVHMSSGGAFAYF